HTWLTSCGKPARVIAQNLRQFKWPRARGTGIRAVLFTARVMTLEFPIRLPDGVMSMTSRFGLSTARGFPGKALTLTYGIRRPNQFPRTQFSNTIKRRSAQRFAFHSALLLTPNGVGPPECSTSKSVNLSIQVLLASDLCMKRLQSSSNFRTKAFP